VACHQSPTRFIFRNLGLLSFLLFFLYGCQFLAPVPVFTEEVIYGSKITDENIAFFNTGRTTREEVIQNLGQPSIEFKDIHIIVYSWLTRIGYLLDSGNTDLAREDLLLVAFDNNDILLNYEISERRTWQFGTIRGYVLRWAERKQIEVPKPSEKFIPLEIPQGQSVIYIFRPKTFLDPSSLNPVVRIDSKVVAQLRKGGYIVSDLQPGIHHISVNPLHGPDSVNVLDLPTRTVSLKFLPDTAYYLQVKLIQGFVIEPEMTIIPEEEAQAVIKYLRPTW
jgi:hypothetical protein